MAQDKYTNIAILDVTESVAGTITFSQLQTGVQAFAKLALVVHRIEWYCGNQNLMLQDADGIQGAITNSNKMTAISLDDPSVLAMIEYKSILSGTAGNREQYVMPVTFDYTGLPGNGRLMPAYPIFISVVGTSLASAVHLTARMFYTQLELKADEYIELVESMRMIE